MPNQPDNASDSTSDLPASSELPVEAAVAQAPSEPSQSAEAPLNDGADVRPPTDVEAVRAARDGIAALHEMVSQLASQRDALVVQIRSLGLELESKRARALEDHLVQLATALRKAESDHAVQIKLLATAQGSAAAEWRAIEAKCAAERARSEKEHSEWQRAARARFDDEIADARKSAQKQLGDESKAAAEAAAAKIREAEAEIKLQRERRLSDLEVREAAVKAQAEQASTVASEAAAVKRRAESDIAIAKEDRETARRTVDDAVKKATGALERRLDAKQKELEREIERSAEKDMELLQLRETARSIGERTAEEVLAELKKLRASELALRGQLANRPTKDDCDKLADENGALRARADQADKDRAELSLLRARKEEWSRSATQLQDAERMRLIEETTRKALEGQVERLTGEVNRLRALYERPRELAERVRLINSPVFPRRNPDRAEHGEMHWLARIEKSCKSSGVIFQRRLLHSFHAALKTAEWSPLTVLSGVSGTGKSKLPELFARYGGINFKSVPVQPNWDSPQAVFGFFNSVDNRFNATALLRLLVQSARGPEEGDGLNDQITIILLDEMNLAHVELYFSDMLSKLEQRRGARVPPALPVDIGADVDPFGVELGRNVLWCGTMNEDETTKTLSDKVLDRGNLLVFPRPTELLRRPDAGERDEAQPLPRRIWESWTAQKSPFTDEQVAEHKQVLEEMSRHMESVGRAIGHRVWQSAEYYMANHPLVRIAQQRPELNLIGEAMRLAFEDQLVLKVMPKLRGIETRGTARRNCIDPIAKLVDAKFKDMSEDFRAALENGSDSFMWRSAHYLQQYPDIEQLLEPQPEPLAKPASSAKPSTARSAAPPAGGKREKKA